MAESDNQRFALTTCRRSQDVRLWQLISPALPVGGYSYSQGLEAAVAAGWVHDADSVAAWIGGLASHAFTANDLPYFLRIHHAVTQHDPLAAAHWSSELAATRETSELRREDAHMAAALSRLLDTLDGDFVPPPGARARCYPAVFAAVTAHWQIAADVAAAGFMWAWLENQINAATRLMPFGQSAAQQTLFALAAEIDACVDAAAARQDDDLGFSAPGLTIASAVHETQYSRLFRS